MSGYRHHPQPGFLLTLFLSLCILSLETEPVSAQETEPAGFENGEMTLQEREAYIWGPRLYASGNNSIPAAAMIRYTHQFDERLSLNHTLPATAVTWQSLGPEGNGGNTPTVGQIHRITFDPRYNGTDNQTLYAASGFGGLWKSTDGARSWSLLHTDQALPFCGIADVCLSDKGNVVYAATGYPDGSVYNNLQPNVSSVNPLFTQGVYRTRDDGNTWEPMHEGLLDHFTNGGVIRRMIRIGENRIIAATSEGIFFCENGAANLPQWKAGQINGNPIADVQLRGLEAKPGSTTVLYASGSDIYTTADGGAHWMSMTGKGTGLDFDSLRKQSDSFVPDRINLAVTARNNKLLYAYIMGHHTTDNASAMFLFRYNGQQWERIAYHKTKNNFDLYSQSYMAIAVDPQNEHLVYWGNTIIHRIDCSEKTEAEVTQFMGYMTNNGGYVDIHALVFEPVQSVHPKLFAANHGGVSMYDFGTSRWSYCNIGICNATIWSFDDNETDPDEMIIALQDHGIRTRQADSSDYHWWMLNTGGDGYSARIYDDIRRKAYQSISWKMINEYDFKTRKSMNVNRGFPKDIPDPGSNPEVFITNTFSCINHPLTREPYLSFSEIYRRIPDPQGKKVEWELESDIGKTILPKWQRQITELAIAQSDPNRVYAVTMGVDNGTNPTEKWHLDPRMFCSTTGFSGGDWNKDVFREIELTNPSSGIPVLQGNVKLPPVSGIAVDPENADRVWITFTGYSKVHKVYRSDDGGRTWINEDPQGLLINLPVNGIVYQSGTKDRLFIATDAGVYTRDRESNWTPYGMLPNVRVTEIKINTCNNTIKAATFGRGVFEAKLPETTTMLPVIRISGPTLWNQDMVITSSIRIEPGGTLTVKGKLLMPAGSSIVVEKKGKLRVDGGTITNACGREWQGILKASPKASVLFLNGGKTEWVKAGP